MVPASMHSVVKILVSFCASDPLVASYLKNVERVEEMAQSSRFYTEWAI